MTTKIEWCDKVWNPTTGCSKVSPGCANCYAVRSARRLGGNPNAKIKARFNGITVKLPNGQLDWTGLVKLVPEKLADPLHWRKPQRVFVNSMSDLFHESLTNEEIAAVFGVMAAARQHTFQILTKRSKRMKEWFKWASKYQIGNDGAEGSLAAIWESLCCESFSVPKRLEGKWDQDGPDVGSQWPLPNVWLGVSVENQEMADERIPDLLDCPAAIRFLSCEPLLGPLDIKHWFQVKFPWGRRPYMNGDAYTRSHNKAKINWVIAGGESGPGARPCDISWLCSIVEDCSKEGVPVFVKQLGSKSGVWYGRDEDSFFDQTKNKDKKGGDPSEWPESLQAREFPGAVDA